MDQLMFFIGVVIFLLGFLTFFGAKDKRSGVGALVLCTVAGGLLLTGSLTYTLKANELGLEISRGRIGESTGPGGNPGGFLGTYGKSPFTSVEKFSSLPYTGDSIDVAMRSRDGGDFSARLTPRWHTDAALVTDPTLIPADRKEITNLELLYRQANRTSDEGEITKKIVHLYLRNAAGDIANKIPTDNVLDAKGKEVVEFGVPNLSVTELAAQIRDKAKTELAKKGVILDEVVIEGKLNLSEKMQAQLDNLAAARTRTQVAIADEATAASEARAAVARAGQVTSIPNLTPGQRDAYCAQIWAQEARRATEKGIPLYTSPCSTGANTLVSAGAAK